MVVVSSGFANSVILTNSDSKSMITSLISSSSSSSRSFIHCNPSSSSLAYVPSQLRIDFGVRKSISDRGSARVNPRCKVVSERTTDVESPSSVKSSSRSALEALKISAGDSKYSILIVVVFCVLKLFISGSNCIRYFLMLIKHLKCCPFSSYMVLTLMYGKAMVFMLS